MKSIISKLTGNQIYALWRAMTDAARKYFHEQTLQSQVSSEHRVSVHDWLPMCHEVEDALHPLLWPTPPEPIAGVPPPINMRGIPGIERVLSGITGKHVVVKTYKSDETFELDFQGTLHNEFGNMYRVTCDRGYVKFHAGNVLTVSGNEITLSL